MLLLTPPARAQPSDDDEVVSRLRFIDQRLQSSARLATSWHVGWTAVYGAGFVAQTGRAVVAEQTSERAELVVSASKAMIGTLARLLRPPQAMFGNRDLRGLRESTPEERLRKLQRAEAILERNARESDARYSWIAHSVNLGLNLAGGLIVWLGYDDFSRAAWSTVIGVGVGELAIWTQPWKPKSDWKDYRRRFGETRVTVAPRVAPGAVGGMLGLSF